MAENLRVCLAQMTSTNRHEGNIAFAEDAARHAAAKGCDLLALPEAAGMMNKDVDDARSRITREEDDPFIAACRRLAAEHGLWIQTGSTPIASGDGRFLNHGNLIDANGSSVAGYDKIHLFDVFLEGRPATGESKRYAAGQTAVLVETPWGPWGLTICYDLRFPHLYRDYAKRGATVIFVPSAFTVPTGEAHWETLLRARAIENGAFIVAAAQVGHHDDGRKTWGHSMIVDPWGKVLLDMGGREPGLAVVDLDLNHVRRAREQIPSLKNERDYDLNHVAGHDGLN
ncbi:carbon-nitrogen hydrolase family protein [Marivita sp. GX14005]|uniref:carbon-nitrogen hydrolase family protein n=1 Tax=Marivita sp. GX14005 TaxID=2942276 RepID=UPI00201914A8|nr:carbon-nitrogen hydrolase family protein [Marivita sp. GX14005]MCL3883360.1 carbon-nitrogen hydrolase family protein [Marivita sp. GX14005]